MYQSIGEYYNANQQLREIRDLIMEIDEFEDIDYFEEQIKKIIMQKH